MATGTLIFSHIIPVILGFLGVILLISGVMDDERNITIIGVVLFVIAAFSPFLVLNLMV
ncbi:hypothetical protein KQY27_03175 [Methanobrevibacter sp. TMH8]|uniref:hypothetical protein n=1 Tax=Methanobrevibacter sp. TMH8 TaxID=2848611 RepID=UPI001CCB8079|nr:hypothetical protein [Methanobrevibacter sp. TMH8]MBZ9570546.1 hypothetical protein [Methanobrevibacter sp. TMH8]